MNENPITIDVSPTPEAEPGQVDLDRLRTTLRTSRANDDLQPPTRARQIFVDSEGRIWLGDEMSLSDEPVSEVHQATFANLTMRQERDRIVVETKLPKNTNFVKVGRTGGWHYAIRTELGDAFQLFAYWEGDSYQVKVVKPAVEGLGDPHKCHLFADGSICFGKEHRAGMPTLEAAYAKSVLWANGYSVFHRTGKFPF